VRSGKQKRADRQPPTVAPSAARSPVLQRLVTDLLVLGQRQSVIRKDDDPNFMSLVCLKSMARQYLRPLQQGHSASAGSSASSASVSKVLANGPRHPGMEFDARENDPTMLTSHPSPFIPPAPAVYRKPLPLWRLLWNLNRSSLAIWHDEVFEAPIARSKVMGVEFLVVNDPDAVRHVMVANASNYGRPVSVRRVVRPLGGSGLFLSEGVDWKRQRRLLAPSFIPASISLMLPHFRDAGLHLLHTIEKTRQANLSKGFQDAALEAVLRALFSMPDNSAREKLGHSVRIYIEGPGRPNLLDVIGARNESDFSWANGQRKRFTRNWFDAIEAIIAERKDRTSDGRHQDMLDLLLSIVDKDTGEALSNSEIRDQCGTLLFAGSETTARLMFWAAYLLTQDLGEQDRVRSEITAFPVERVSALDDLKNWPRLRNVLLEALRLYPPLPHIVREALGGDEVAGEKVSPGMQLWFSAWVMHRHRRFWEQPTAFMPDRFASSGANSTQTPAYIPFGTGPRICIGLSFALSEAHIVLATLLSCYKVGLISGKPVMPLGRATIEPSYEPAFQLEPV
jgi:cytochrome P450